MYSLQEIEQAIANGELFLEYLPTIRLADGRCVGCEALVRWQKGSEVIPPLDFVLTIEKTALSGMLTYWVIDQVASELGDWLLKTEEVHVGINIPSELWGRGGIFYTLQKSVLNKVSEKMILELSERGVPDAIGISTIQTFGSRTKLALDDVQAKEANILALARLKVDFIKIDKTFIDLILQDTWEGSREEKLLKSFSCDYQHQYIAEGVETAEQAKVLHNAGFQFAQGWYFSRPLRAKHFLEFFASQRLAMDYMV